MSSFVVYAPLCTTQLRFVCTTLAFTYAFTRLFSLYRVITNLRQVFKTCTTNKTTLSRCSLCLFVSLLIVLVSDVEHVDFTCTYQFILHLLFGLVVGGWVFTFALALFLPPPTHHLHKQRELQNFSHSLSPMGKGNSYIPHLLQRKSANPFVLHLYRFVVLHWRSISLVCTFLYCYMIWLLTCIYYLYIDKRLQPLMYISSL